MKMHEFRVIYTRKMYRHFVVDPPSVTKLFILPKQNLSMVLMDHLVVMGGADP